MSCLKANKTFSYNHADDNNDFDENNDNVVDATAGVCHDNNDGC